jgi:hypothetical protein
METGFQQEDDALRRALKRADFLFLHFLSPSVTCLKASYWSGSFPPYPFSLIGPVPLAFLPQNLCKSYTSQLCYLSLEDGNGMFLRIIGIDLRNHTVQYPGETPTCQCLV